MADQPDKIPPITHRQERRIHWRYGLTETQARIFAPFIYGRAGE